VLGPLQAGEPIHVFHLLLSGGLVVGGKRSIAVTSYKQLHKALGKPAEKKASCH